MRNLRASSANRMGYCAVPLDNFGMGYYMVPQGLGSVVSADDGSTPTTGKLGKMLTIAALVAAGIIIISRIPGQMTSRSGASVRRNPYGPNAEFYHLTARRSSDFMPGKYLPVDRGSKGKKGQIKALLGHLRPEVGDPRPAHTQKVMVSKKSVPKKCREIMHEMEERLEKAPAGSSALLRQAVMGRCPTIGRRLNVRR